MSDTPQGNYKRGIFETLGTDGQRAHEGDRGAGQSDYGDSEGSKRHHGGHRHPGDGEKEDRRQSEGAGMTREWTEETSSLRLRDEQEPR